MTKPPTVILPSSICQPARAITAVSPKAIINPWPMLTSDKVVLLNTDASS